MKTLQKVTFPEARKLVEQAQPTRSYSAAVGTNIGNKTTVSVGVQTLLSWSEGLRYPQMLPKSTQAAIQTQTEQFISDKIQQIRQGAGESSNSGRAASTSNESVQIHKKPDKPSTNTSDRVTNNDPKYKKTISSSGSGSGITMVSTKPTKKKKIKMHHWLSLSCLDET